MLHYEWKLIKELNHFTYNYEQYKYHQNTQMLESLSTPLYREYIIAFTCTCNLNIIEDQELERLR